MGNFVSLNIFNLLPNLTGFHIFTYRRDIAFPGGFFTLFDNEFRFGSGFFEINEIFRGIVLAEQF